jgi:hypothetical protein
VGVLLFADSAWGYTAKNLPYSFILSISEIFTPATFRIAFKERYSSFSSAYVFTIIVKLLLNIIMGSLQRVKLFFVCRHFEGAVLC